MGTSIELVRHKKKGPREYKRYGGSRYRRKVLWLCLVEPRIRRIESRAEKQQKRENGKIWGGGGLLGNELSFNPLIYFPCSEVGELSRNVHVAASALKLQLFQTNAGLLFSEGKH